MAKTIGSIFVDLGVNTGRFKADLKQANSASAKFQRGVRRSFRSARVSVSKMGGAVGSLKLQIIALAGPAALGLLVKSSFEAGDALAKTADKLGLTTERLAGLQLAARLTGVEQKTMNKALTKQQKAIFDANRGLLTYKQHFDALNLSTAELMEMSPDEQFVTIAEALNKVENQTLKTAIAYDVFGGRGTALLNTLKLGKEGLDAISAEAVAFGTAISRVDAAKIEAANDAMARAGEVVRGAGLTIATELSPVVKALADDFSDAAVANGGFRKEIEAGIRTTIVAGVVMVDAFEAVGDAAGEVWDGFTSLPSWVQQAGVAGAILGGKKGIAIVLGISKLTDSLGTTLEGFEAVAADKFSFAELASANHAELKALLDSTKTDFEKAMEAFREAEEGSTFFGNSERRTEVLTWLDSLNAKIKSASSATILSGGSEDDGSVDTGLKARFEALDQSLQSEEERLQMSYVNRADIVLNAIESGITSDAAGMAIIESLHEQHENKLTEIKLRGLNLRDQFLRKSMQMQVKQVAGSLAQMTAGVASSNRSMFEINKVAGIANAVVNTAQGVTKALAAYPPPLSFIMAGAQAAAGAAQIAAIKSTSFGGGGSVSAIGGGGGVPSLATSPGIPVTPTDSQAAQSHVTVVIDDDAILTGGAIRNLVDKLNEAHSDGYTLEVSNG